MIRGAMAACDPHGGALFRWTRRLLILLAGLALVSWLVTTSGLYFWFNIGAEDRFRFEYGRIVWRHVDGGTTKTYAGVDGGASKALWSFERIDYGSRQITHIPLWMPFLLFAGAALGLTLARRVRSGSSGASEALSRRGGKHPATETMPATDR